MMGARVENISLNDKCFNNDAEFNGYINEICLRVSNKEQERVYTYDEAIDLTGNGWYNISLLITLALAIQAMALDMFGFSYVVAASACDLQLSHTQTSFLLTVPLIGVIISSYPWGYFSDTRGRKKSLTIALWGSFFVAILSTFSPNFTVLAVFKLFSSALCSGALSVAYTLLGESCSARTKGGYMLIMTSALMCGFPVYTAHAYLVFRLRFAYDLGFITFKPWRLLILTYSMALGSSAMLVHFFYESPKFLVNVGRTVEAVNILSLIKKRNRVPGAYKVKKIVLLEACSLQRTHVSFARSLWQQTTPLFQPPLLQRTLLLFYITASIYSVNNGFFLWLPIMLESFFEDSSVYQKNTTDSFCELINSRPSPTSNDDCTSTLSLDTLVTSIIEGLIFCTINFGVARLAHMKKTVIIITFVISFLCCLGLSFVTQKIITIILFFGVQVNCIGMGIVFTYFVELFPTNYRGMISCLGMMVARISALVGVNLVGAYTFTHCTTSLYFWGAYIFSSLLTSLLLPPDAVKVS